MRSFNADRRSILATGGLGLAGGIAAAAATTLSPQVAYAQAAGDSLLRTVLDRGHLIVGTGSTNAPWHFEDEQGNLTVMDIAMARFVARGLFDDETKVEYVRQEADARVRHAQVLVSQGKYADALPLLRRAQQLKHRENVQQFLDQVEKVAASR